MMLFQNNGRRALMKIAALATASLALSGCVYDVGLGYASDGYYGDNYYDCDPYGGFDGYYDCDNRYGFGNIGYGGGWYDNFYYPGYGFTLFDSYGRRHQMRDNHRRYWGERRHRWYRENRGGRDGDYRDGRGREYTDGDRRPRSDGQRRRGRSGQTGDVSATPQPTADSAPQPGRGEGRRGGRQRWNNDQQGSVNVPRTRGDGAIRGQRYRQSGTDNSTQSAAPVVERAPPSNNLRPERARRDNFERSNERPD